MLTITVDDYRPEPGLDEELAELGYAAIRGWPDQAPVNPLLARAMLRPSGQTATTLALHRDEHGRLLAAAAVRWPATLDSAGRLWGPMVRPEARRLGLARALMSTVTEVLDAHPGMLVSTTTIPESRTEGWALFEAAGWSRVEPAELYQRPVDPEFSTMDIPGVRSATPGEYLDSALAELFAAGRPELGPVTARDTFLRWSADSRYVPNGLLLAHAGERLVGAAIVYPSRMDGGDEPAEALLSDLLVAADLDPYAAGQLRRSLVAAALRAGAENKADIARATVDHPDLAATLVEAGFTLVDRVRRYTRRGAKRQ